MSTAYAATACSNRGPTGNAERQLEAQPAFLHTPSARPHTTGGSTVAASVVAAVGDAGAVGAGASGVICSAGVSCGSSSLPSSPSCPSSPSSPSSPWTPCRWTPLPHAACRWTPLPRAASSPRMPQLGSHRHTRDRRQSDKACSLCG